MGSRPPNALWDQLILVSQVGLTMAGSILLCFAGGYYLDRWLDSKPLFTIVLLLAGIVGGGYTAYRQIMEVGVDRPPDDEGPGHGEP